MSLYVKGVYCDIIYRNIDVVSSFHPAFIQICVLPCSYLYFCYWWLIHTFWKAENSMALWYEYIDITEIFENLPHTSHIIGMIRVQKKEGRMPYVRLVITNPGQITDEYRPYKTENQV